jgi:hypothetical protein
MSLTWGCQWFVSLGLLLCFKNNNNNNNKPMNFLFSKKIGFFTNKKQGIIIATEINLFFHMCAKFCTRKKGWVESAEAFLNLFLSGFVPNST